MERLYKFISNLDQPYDEIFTIIKPGFLKLSGEIIKIFEEHGWWVFKTDTKMLTIKQAHDLYKIHKKEDWYEPLCKYMSSGESTAILFRKTYNKPQTEPKDIYKEVGKIKDEIRDRWGESDMRNVMHSSDSKEHMEDEMKIYF